MEDIICLAQDMRSFIETLGQWGLLAKEGVLTCSRCGSCMKLARDASRGDQFKWACIHKVSINKKKAMTCGTFQTLRKNTFFENAALSIKQILLFCHLWTHNVELQVIQLETRISKATAVHWSSFCHEVVIAFGFRQQKPIGGENMTVEINESKFGKRKYRRGHHLEGQFIFGGVCRETGDVFLVPVERCDASTLIPLINKWIVPGSTIVSDCWKAYDGLDEVSFRHLKSDHSVDLNDPAMGAPDNTIQVLWRHDKDKLPVYNRRKSLFGGYLAKFLFIHYCKAKKLDPSMEFFKAAGMLYNPYIVAESSTAAEVKVMIILQTLLQLLCQQENENIQNTEGDESPTVEVKNEPSEEFDEESPDYIDYNAWDLYE